jgi:hypothetical protein
MVMDQLDKNCRDNGPGRPSFGQAKNAAPEPGTQVNKNREQLK